MSSQSGLGVFVRGWERLGMLAISATQRLVPVVSSYGQVFGVAVPVLSHTYPISLYRYNNTYIIGNTYTIDNTHIITPPPLFGRPDRDPSSKKNSIMVDNMYYPIY